MIVQLHAAELTHADDRKSRFMERVSIAFTIRQSIALDQLFASDLHRFLQTDFGDQ